MLEIEYKYRNTITVKHIEVGNKKGTEMGVHRNIIEKVKGLRFETRRHYQQFLYFIEKINIYSINKILNNLYFHVGFITIQ